MERERESAAAAFSIGLHTTTTWELDPTTNWIENAQIVFVPIVNFSLFFSWPQFFKFNLKTAVVF